MASMLRAWAGGRVRVRVRDGFKRKLLTKLR